MSQTIPPQVSSDASPPCCGMSRAPPAARGHASSCTIRECCLVVAPSLPQTEVHALQLEACEILLSARQGWE